MRVIYGYVSSATLTTNRLHYKLQTRPLIREGAPRRRAKQLSGKRREKNNLAMGPNGCPTPRQIGLLTIDSTELFSESFYILKLAFWTLSIVPDCLNDKIVKKTNTTFQKLDLLPSSGKITKGGYF
jgi:hypothetical protein